MKKTVQNLFTLVIAVLLIINTLPSMVYADEEIPVEDPSQAQVEVISETGNEQTPSDTQQENLTPVQEEKKEESPVNEVKEKKKKQNRSLRSKLLKKQKTTKQPLRSTPLRLLKKRLKKRLKLSFLKESRSLTTSITSSRPMVPEFPRTHPAHFQSEVAGTSRRKNSIIRSLPRISKSTVTNMYTQETGSTTMAHRSAHQSALRTPVTQKIRSSI